MEEKLSIPKHLLKLDEEVPFEKECSSEFLQIKEPYLRFDQTVVIKGVCCQQNEGIYLQYQLQTEASMPCTICNEWANCTIELKNVDHFEKNSPSCDNDFDFSNIVRESILLETPKYIECNGKCDKRDEITKYLKKEDHGSTTF